jgi:hypothetical protein
VSDTLDFPQALAALKEGHASAIQRAGWNGAGLLVKIQRPDENSKMTAPYLFIEYPLTNKTLPGARFPWVCSQADLMAEDWAIIG